MSPLRRLRAGTAGFPAALATLMADATEFTGEIERRVAEILAAVRREGDGAVLRYTRRFDTPEVADIQALCVPPAALARAEAAVSDALRTALTTAAARLRTYAEHQRLQDWSYTDEFGNRLGQQVRPLDRVGIYAPGGKAAYPSSVLMNAVPAKVAGVPEVVLCVPAPGGVAPPAVLAAAAIAEVDRVFLIGGAQAIGALAYGTETVPAVDKIVGPGNSYVATAKRQVFGRVGIDMIAGPSEIVIVCDGDSNPDWTALDLFAQAEHDEQARALLISPDPAYLDAVEAAIGRLLPTQPRAPIIRAALEGQTALIEVADLAEAAAVVNQLAPEHLELAVAEPAALAAQIRHAGAIFLGRHTAEAVGDYCAGPNHVLPTGRSARFFSPLGVYDFQKRSSIIECSVEGATALGHIASTLATAEGLHAHAASAAARIVTADE